MTEWPSAQLNTRAMDEAPVGFSRRKGLIRHPRSFVDIYKWEYLCDQKQLLICNIYPSCDGPGHAGRRTCAGAVRGRKPGAAADADGIAIRV